MATAKRHRLLWAGVTTLALFSAPIAPAPMGAPAYAAPRAPKLTDNCDSLRQPFRQIRDYQVNKIIGGVAKGGLLGAAIGALGAAVSGRDVGEGAALGGIAGATAGGLIAYFESKKQVAENQAALQAAIDSDFSQDVGQYGPVAEAIATLGNCRVQQIVSVRSAYEAKQIDQKTGLAQLSQIEAWVKKDDDIISKAAKMQSNAVGAYARASAMASGRDPKEVESASEAIVQDYEKQGAGYQQAVYTTYVEPNGKEFPTEIEEPITETRYVVGTRGYNLRGAPGADAPVVRFLPRGTQVEIDPNISNGYAKVFAGEGEGYLSETALSANKPEKLRSAAPAATPEPAKKRMRKVRRDPPPGSTLRIAVRPAQAPSGQVSKVKLAAATQSSVREANAARRTAVDSTLTDARRALEKA